MLQWERWSSCPDSQEVGLEAAILERVRNSSLVEWGGADNVTGLSIPPKLRVKVSLGAFGDRGHHSGRGAFHAAVKVDRKDGWSAWKCECRHE
jgi:hypothetical protein